MLLKIGKWFVGIFGTILTFICLGLGIFGVSKAEENKSFINNSISTVTTEVNNAQVQIDEVVAQIKANLNGDIQGYKDLIQSKYEPLEEQFKQIDHNFQTYINDLEGSLDKIKETNLPAEFQDLKDQAIREVESTIKLIESEKDNTLNTIEKIKAQVDEIVNAIDLDQIKSSVDTIVNLIDKYMTTINNVTTKLNSQNVNHYYDATSYALLWTGVTLTGLIVVGSVFSFIFYKKVDGKLVSRMSAKKEVREHLIKILKKHPSIVNEL